MAERQKLTALITVGDEEEHIGPCIESVRFADEVVVIVDASAGGRTEQIAREMGATVHVNDYKGAAAQKNFGIPKASHPWVLVVDSDERVTPELAREVQEVLRRDGPLDGYRVYRQNYFAGRLVRGCGWQRDDVLRLFRRDRSKYIERRVHPDIIPADGKPYRTGHLKGRLLHYTFDSFSQYLYKHGRYAEWASHDREKHTPRVGYRHIMLRPVWRFFRQFVLYGGWRDGIMGFIICWMAAHSVFLKYAHVWERQELGSESAREKEQQDRDRRG